uniref:C2H2-type domain-containing protein n=1 Tax=Cyprinus carpio TaxID=7962 RepID=A0A8C2FKU2_CYPCA
MVFEVKTIVLDSIVFCFFFSRAMRHLYMLTAFNTHLLCVEITRNIQSQSGTRSLIRTVLRDADLKKHQRMHSEEKPYKCSICNKIFKWSEYLKLHERTHTGDKPYKCSHCDKRFRWSDYVKRHERIHTGEQPYHCIQCGKSFCNLSSLLSHTKKKCLKSQ